MFDSSLPPVVCRMDHIVFTLFDFLRVVVSNTYCVVFLLCLSSSCVPCIASFSGISIFVGPSIFSNVYISNIKIVEIGKIDTPNTQIHDRSLSWLGTGTLIKKMAELNMVH